MTKICLNYPKLMQISLNLAEIEAHPKCIRNKSSEILNFFSAEIPSLFLMDFNGFLTIFWISKGFSVENILCLNLFDFA